MSLEFGSSLFRNRKGPAAEHSPASAGELAPTLEELNERIIVLCKEDIVTDATAAPLLDWSTVEKGEIAVQLKDTDGLSEGNVTIKASTLQRIHPALFPIRPEAEYLFPISLKTVVLQVQSHLRQSSEERQEQVGADFDTPIAQVAREDEGFFKLANVAEPKVTPIDEMAQAKRNIPGPVLTPADRPSSPMSRRKFPPETRDSRPSLCSSVAVPSSAHAESPETKVRQADRTGPNREAVEQNSLRRIGLERLREIFMTEDHLDAPQVANLRAAFPKVNSAIVMLGDGTILGGNIPDGYLLETARLAPVIVRSVQEFDRRLRSNETSAFTLLGDRPVTLFAEGKIYILISHEGRGLLPGVRERIGKVARALDAVVC